MVPKPTNVRMQPIKLERFLPRDSQAFQSRTAQMQKYLKAGLLQGHFAYALNIRGMDWMQIITETLTADLTGVKGIRDFSKIIDEVDGKSAGWILDRATILMRELYSEIKGKGLEPGRTLIDFLKQPAVEADTVTDKTVTNFDPIEMLVRTFGYVGNFIDMGKNGYLLPARLAVLEQRFTDGYIFLRAAQILSDKA
jgi:hypothetical protein